MASAVRTLGYETQTAGYFWHEVQSGVLEMVPTSLLESQALNMHKGELTRPVSESRVLGQPLSAFHLYVNHRRSCDVSCDDMVVRALFLPFFPPSFPHLITHTLPIPLDSRISPTIHPST